MASGICLTAGVSGPGAVWPNVSAPGMDGNAYKYDLARQGFPVRWYLLEQLPHILAQLQVRLNRAFL